MPGDRVGPATVQITGDQTGLTGRPLVLKFDLENVTACFAVSTSAAAPRLPPWGGHFFFPSSSFATLHHTTLPIKLFLEGGDVNQETVPGLNAGAYSLRHHEP